MRRQEKALSKACLVGVVAACSEAAPVAVQAQELKKYNSSTKAFWANPPADWFLGDETKEQKGQTPNPGQPTPTPGAELEKILANIKLPPGFKIACGRAAFPRRGRWRWATRARCSSAPSTRARSMPSADRTARRS